MKIGIIGAGRIGQALARRWLPKGHDIMISNSRGVSAVQPIADDLGCHAGTSDQAARFGQVVVVSVPLNRFDELPLAALDGTIVIDTCNFYPNRDGAHPEFETGPQTTSGYLQALIPAAKVVKAFNSIMSPQLETGGIALTDGQQHALPIASDDAAAAEMVAKLVRDVGLEPLFYGPLGESWRFERARPAYCIPMNKADLSDALDKTTKFDFVAEGSWRG